jgi:hypothetical protein
VTSHTTAAGKISPSDALVARTRVIDEWRAGVIQLIVDISADQVVAGCSSAANKWALTANRIDQVIARIRAPCRPPPSVTRPSLSDGIRSCVREELASSRLPYRVFLGPAVENAPAAADECILVARRRCITMQTRILSHGDDVVLLPVA